MLPRTRTQMLLTKVREAQTHSVNGARRLQKALAKGTSKMPVYNGILVQYILWNLVPRPVDVIIRVGVPWGGGG